MSKEKFLPIVLGSDENAYGTSRLFYEAYGIKPLLICTRQLIPTLYSKLFSLRKIENFDRDDVFCESLLSVLKEQAEKYEKLIVVPCSDYYSAMLSKYYGKFEGLIANEFISPDLLSTLDTKDRFYALCEKHGAPYPETLVVEKADRLSAVDSLPFSFPIVVKPENSNAYDYLHASFEGKKKVYFFSDRESYVTLIESMNKSPYKGKLVIQKFIKGGDSSMRVINSYSDKNGKVKAMCLGQPVLEEYSPKTLGNYAAIISRKDTELCEKVRAFLEDIGYVGFSNIDMKYDPEIGEYLMFEINPRLGRSSFFVRGAGINMMKVLTDDAVFGKDIPFTLADTTALWANVPKAVIREYVKNRELKSEAETLIKERKFSDTLSCPRDMNIKRLFWIKRYYLGQYKNFKKYYFDK